MPLSTPPPSRYNGEMIQHGLQQLAEHNASTPYPQEQYPHSTYTTPEAQYSQSEYNLGFQYDGYNPELQGTLYHDPEYQRGYTYPNTPATSPPTPQHTIRTRSGLQVRPSPVGRSKASPAPRPPKKSRKDKAKAESKVKLTAPLSEITANWDHIPIVDIEAYVNRSAEERRREIEEGKAPGKVKRPMNSFMLYRKAYQNRTKEYCLQTNHQIVSQVCGESWPMEPDHIRDQFTEWARIERDNHANAHPGYKFTPSKPPTLADRKRKHSEHPEDESDLEEYDPTYHGGRTIKKHRSNKSTPIHTPRQQTAVYTSGKPAYQYSRETSMEPIQGNYHRSHFFTSNPGRPYPAQYNQASLQHGQYYQQETVDHHNGQIQDVIMKKTGYVGLPGGQDFDLMHQAQTPYPQYQATPPPEHQIDPILMGQDQSLYDGNYGTPEPPFFGGSHDGNMNAIDPLLHFEGDRGLDLDIPDEHIHMLRGQQDGWEVNSLDISRDFDEKWFETK